MTTTAPATARKPATMAQALTRALRDAMAEDPSVHVMGEDVGALGGVFRVTDGLAKEFGEDRCTDTALAEEIAASWAPPSAWRCTGCGRSSRCSSTPSPTRRSSS